MRKTFFLCIAMVLFFIMFPLNSQATPTSIFINEIHYDNVGTDTGEGVEIAGPAGTDLTPWSLLFYNGANDTVYGTTRLSGVIPNQSSGYGTVFFSLPSNGIQNGSADAIALVRVREFVSYEGSFTSATGLASGLTTKDIGMFEGSSTAVGYSLQLVGTGNSSKDFTWTGPQPNTSGAVNTGQTFGGFQIDPSIFINELHYDNIGTDTGEGVEIAGFAGTTLTPWSLLFYNGADDTVYGTTRLSGVIPNQSNGYGTVFFGLPSDGIQNGPADAIALLEVTQFLSYEGSFTSATDLASGLTTKDIGVFEPSSTNIGYSLQLKGTGRAYEDFTWTGPIPNTFGGINTGQSFSAQAVPEPSTLLLLSSGLIGLAGYGRKKFFNK